MEFINATYLWGLLGLLVPIAIHLWSRKKVVTIKVGSIKLLQESEPKQTSSIHINEWWLLAFRMLMIALLVFIMVAPSLVRKMENQSVNYIIEPSLLQEQRMSSFLDTIPEDALRVLTEGFPTLKEYPVYTQNEVTPYWQLAQKMHTIPADSLVVFTKGLQKGIRGKRPQITASTNWIVLASQNEMQVPILAINKPNHTLLVSALSDANSLLFKKDTITLTDSGFVMNKAKDSIQLTSANRQQWIKLEQQSPIQVGINLHDSLQEQSFYLEGSFKAISKFIDRPIDIIKNNESISFEELNMLVVDSKENVPNDFSGTVLIYTPNGLQKKLIVAGHRPNEFYLTKELNSENIVSEQGSEQLLTLLTRSNTYNSLIQKADHRVVSDAEFQPEYKIASAVPLRSTLLDLTPWLWILLLATVIIERILSRVRKQ